jgi:hypothetical protein
VKASEAQILRLRQFGIDFDDDISREDAAEILKSFMREKGVIGPRPISAAQLGSALAVESEGDPQSGRQYEV